jgi:hypothetical protein
MTDMIMTINTDDEIQQESDQEFDFDDGNTGSIGKSSKIVSIRYDIFTMMLTFDRVMSRLAR